MSPAQKDAGKDGGRRAAPGVRLFGVVSLAAPGALALDGVASSARARLHTPPLGTPVAEVVRVGDLGAVVAPARYAPEPLTAEVVRVYRAVVESVFAERAVLPAPPGTVFRTRAALAAWVELHAGALAEGLRFVEDRVEARVTADGPPAAALDAFAVLRRAAAALLVLREGDVELPVDARPAAADLPTGGPAADARAAASPAGVAPLAPSTADAQLRSAEGRAAGAAGGALPGYDPHARGAHAALLVDRAGWGAFSEAVAREGGRRADLRLACAGPWPPYSFVRLDFSA